MSGRSRVLALLVAGPIATALAAARADAPRDPAAARALFQEGRALLDAGDWPGACAKFDASLALNPAVSALLNTAACHEHDGKLTLAWEDYQRALVLNRETESKTRKKEFDDFIAQALATLGPRLPKLRVTVRPVAPGLRFLRDGIEMPPSALGAELPIDPGEHDVLISAPGYAGAMRHIRAEERRTTEVAIELVVEAAAPSAQVAVAPVAAAPIAPPRARTADRAATAAPVWPWVTGGTGIALLGVGVGFVFYAQGGAAWITDHCDTHGAQPTCDPTKVSASDVSAHNDQKDVGTGLGATFLAAGVVALGASVWGFATAKTAPAPTRSATTWRVAPSGRGILVTF